MIAAKYTQEKGFEVGESPLPLMAEDEILLRVEASAICGTDLKIVQHGHRKLRDGQTIILGHEFVGRIDKVGSRVKGYERGMRVGVALPTSDAADAKCANAAWRICVPTIRRLASTATARRRNM